MCGCFRVSNIITQHRSELLKGLVGFLPLACTLNTHFKVLLRSNSVEPATRLMAGAKASPTPWNALQASSSVSCNIPTEDVDSLQQKGKARSTEVPCSRLPVVELVSGLASDSGKPYSLQRLWRLIVTAAPSTVLHGVRVAHNFPQGTIDGARLLGKVYTSAVEVRVSFRASPFPIANSQAWGVGSCPSCSPCECSCAAKLGSWIALQN